MARNARQILPTVSIPVSIPIIPISTSSSIPPVVTSTSVPPPPSTTSTLDSSTAVTTSSTTVLSSVTTSSLLLPTTSSSVPPVATLTSSTTLPPTTDSTSAFTTATTTSTPVVVIHSTDSNGQVITVTSTNVVISPTGASNGSAITTQNDTASKGFFKNHGAVAGVFTVVGLVALALLIALLTNAIRRRRALKFDKDVAVAAREAAAAAHASPPDFHDFDDEEYSYGNANRSIYTDQTHGSYNQPPLKPTGYESFNLAELPAATMVGAGYGGEQRVGGGPWNSAGVGATGLNRARSTTTPYNAFAGPVGHGNTMPVADPFHDDQSVPIGGVYPAQPQPYHVPGDSREANLLAAAGIGGAVGAVTTAREHGSAHSRSRSGKLNASPPAMSEHEEGAYNPYEYSQYPPSVPVYQPPQQQQQQRPVSTATSAENPYSAYVSPTQDQYSGEDSDKHEEEEEEEDEDDDDDYRYGGGRRVLKVANE